MKTVPLLSPLPEGAAVVGETAHPRDAACGHSGVCHRGWVVRYRTGIESLTYADGTTRTLPRDWRTTPGAVESE